MLAGCYPRNSRGASEQLRPLQKTVEPGRTIGRGGFTERLSCSRDSYFFISLYFLKIKLFRHTHTHTIQLKILKTRYMASLVYIVSPRIARAA